jgi:hypothetical protein
MTYDVRKVPAGTTSVYEVDVWEVFKQPAHGDLYVVATYDNESLANWCLGSLAGSIEARAGK